MTRYLLNSGGIQNGADKGAQFFNDVLKDLSTTPKVLICFFAQPREYWEERFQADRIFFKTLFQGTVQPVLDCAFPDTFEKQIEASDAIYIHGGDDHLLMYWLKKFDVPRIWDGKVVATNSASSHALSQYFWTCDWRECMNGLAILPIKFLAHFQSPYGQEDPRGPIDWQAAYTALEHYGDTTLPLYALKEGEYAVFEA